MRDALHADLATHHDGGASAAGCLNEALAKVTRASSEPSRAYSATVAELCRLVGISRNSLYRYHALVLEALRNYQRKRVDFKLKQLNVIDGLKKENAARHDRMGRWPRW
jgi:hypothetical protein